MVGGSGHPSMIFRSKMNPRLASSRTQEAGWRQGTWWIGPIGEGCESNPTWNLKVLRGVVPKNQTQYIFVTTTNILSLRIFFKTRPCLLLHEFLRWCFVIYKRQGWKRAWNNGSPEGENGGEETFESTACVLLIAFESRRPLKKSAIAKAERITIFFWLFERLETCKDPLF